MSHVVRLRREPVVFRPATRALAYSFFRRGWSMMLAAIGIFCLLPSALLALVRLLNPNTADALTKSLGSLQWIFFLLFVFGLPLLVQSVMLSVRPLYPLPLSTRRIVNTQLVLGLLMVIGVHLSTVLYYRLMYGGVIPLVGPLGFLLPGVCIASGLMALLADFRWLRPLLALIVMSGLVWRAGAGRFPGYEPTRLDGNWLTPTSTDLAVLIPLAGVGYEIARRTVAKDRRGELGSWRVVEEALYRLLRGVGRWIDGWRQFAVWSPIAAASPLKTQLSYEWWTRGLIFPCLASVVLLISLIAAWTNPGEWCTEYLRGLPAMLILGMMCNGLICGSVSSSGNLSTMDRCRSTRPLSDRHLSYVGFLNGLVSSSAALLISLLVASVVFGLAVLSGENTGQMLQKGMAVTRGDFGGSGTAYAVLLLLAGVGGWGLLGCTCSLTQTGRGWLLVGVGFSYFATFPAIAALGSVLSPEAMERVMTYVSLKLTTLTAFGTVAAFLAARALRLIELRHLLAGLVLWAVAAGVLLANVVSREELRWELLVGTIEFGAIAALPLATGPLAVRWNRHR